MLCPTLITTFPLYCILYCYLSYFVTFIYNKEFCQTFMYPLYISLRFTWCKTMFIWTIQGEWKSRNKWWHSGTPCFTSGFRVRLVWSFVIFLFNSCLWTVDAFVFEPTIQGEAQSLIKYQVALPVLKFVLCEVFIFLFFIVLHLSLKFWLFCIRAIPFLNSLSLPGYMCGVFQYDYCKKFHGQKT